MTTVSVNANERLEDFFSTFPPMAQNLSISVKETPTTSPENIDIEITKSGILLSNRTWIARRILHKNGWNQVVSYLGTDATFADLVKDIQQQKTFGTDVPVFFGRMFAFVAPLTRKHLETMAENINQTDTRLWGDWMQTHAADPKSQNFFYDPEVIVAFTTKYGRPPIPVAIIPHSFPEYLPDEAKTGTPANVRLFGRMIHVLHRAVENNVEFCLTPEAGRSLMLSLWVGEKEKKSTFYHFVEALKPPKDMTVFYDPQTTAEKLKTDSILLSRMATTHFFNQHPSTDLLWRNDICPNARLLSQALLAECVLTKGQFDLDKTSFTTVVNILENVPDIQIRMAFVDVENNKKAILFVNSDQKPVLGIDGRVQSAEYIIGGTNAVKIGSVIKRMRQKQEKDTSKTFLDGR